jgi:hypothetical protein
MKECDNSKINKSGNSNILSKCLLIMLDTLLLTTSLHCNTSLHFTTLHPSTLHYSYRHFMTTLIYTSSVQNYCFSYANKSWFHNFYVIFNMKLHPALCLTSKNNFKFRNKTRTERRHVLGRHTTLRNFIRDVLSLQETWRNVSC